MEEGLNLDISIRNVGKPRYEQKLQLLASVLPRKFGGALLVFTKVSSL